MEVGGRKLARDLHVRPRDDVEDDGLGHAPWPRGGQAPRDAPSAVVPDHGESVEAEDAHDSDLVLEHRTLRVAGVVLPLERLAAVAVSAQVRGDHGEPSRHRGVRNCRRESCMVGIGGCAA